MTIAEAIVQSVGIVCGTGFAAWVMYLMFRSI